MVAMRRTKPMQGLAALLTAGMVVGCDNDTTEPAEPLSIVETEALYNGVQELAMDTTLALISVSPNGGVLACPLGGQVATTIEVREEMAADTARLLSSVTLNPEGCVLSSAGNEFTLDGNPDVRTEVNTSIVASTFEFLVEGTITGGLDWILDDRSGTCLIDLTIGVDLGQPPTATVSGTMCDHEVEFDAGGLVPSG